MPVPAVTLANVASGGGYSPRSSRVGQQAAVRTHVAAACVVCNSCGAVVSTGITSDYNSANTPTPADSTANMTS